MAEAEYTRTDPSYFVAENSLVADQLIQLGDGRAWPWPPR